MATALAGVVLGMAAMVGFAETGDAKRFGQRLAHSTAVLSALRSEPPAGPIRKALTRAVSVDDVAEVPGQYRITPKRQALLNTIRFAEGTWLEGSNRGYQILYGGGTFQDLSRHPERVVVKRYTSTAASAYQFLQATWSVAAQSLSLCSFEPQA